MSFENLENPEITKEDKEMHYECISEVEKNFINFVRNFRSQEWLKGMTLSYIEDTINDMVDLTVGEIAFEGATKFMSLSNTEPKKAYQHFLSAKDNIDTFMEEDELDEIICKWEDVIKSTVIDNLTEYTDSVEMKCDEKLDK